MALIWIEAHEIIKNIFNSMQQIEKAERFHHHYIIQYFGGSELGSVLTATFSFILVPSPKKPKER